MMISITELKKSCNAVLKRLYPGMKIYGADSTNGLVRPSFYTEIVPYSTNRETRNYAKQSAGYKVTMLEQVPDEETQLALFDWMREAFGMKLAVGSRKINVTGIEFDYTGKNNDVFQVTVRFEWYDNTRTADTHDLMQEVTMNTEMKGE